MIQNEGSANPRVIIIQKLYSHHINKDAKINFPKHRYNKFIKDVVNGSIERNELIQNFIDISKDKFNPGDLHLIGKLKK